MTQVTVTIAGKTYRMACDDGQEEHLITLASRLDATIDELRGVFGEIGDQRLTVMSAITMMDRMTEIERRLAIAEAELATLRDENHHLFASKAETERVIAERMLDAATKIEAVAEKLDGT